MKCPDLLFLSALSLLFFGSNAVGQSVGSADFEVDSTTGNPAFSARLWYPTSDSVEQLFGASRIRPGYLAVPDGEISLNDQAPLIILNHGSGGSADSLAWLATEFAIRGALVIAADHPASSGGDPERASMLEIWTQPEDVQAMLDQLLVSDWSRFIDQQRIAVIGFSLGGATAMSLAGARLHFERFPAFCVNHDDGACQAFRHLFAQLDNDFFARANGNFFEPRLRAAVAIAPGFSESITAESLQALPTPVLLIAGEMDQQLPPETHLYPMQHLLPENSRYLEITGAQHFSFLPECGEGAIAVLAETNEEFVCQEMGNKTRKEIHFETIAIIESFLIANDVLPN